MRLWCVLGLVLFLLVRCDKTYTLPCIEPGDVCHVQPEGGTV